MPPVQHQIRRRGSVGRFRSALEADARPQFPLAHFVDGTVADRPPQPPGRVRRAFNPGELLVELQKYILRQFFRPRAVADEAQREAEDHRLVGLRRSPRNQASHLLLRTTRTRDCKFPVLR